MSDRHWVKDLEPGSEVEESYAVRSKELRQRRGGGKYLVVSLSDRTGEFTALAWDNVEHLAGVCTIGAVVRVRGQAQSYNNRLQVIITRAVVVPADEVDEGLFVKATSADPELLWHKLLSHVEETPDEHLRQLLFRVFSDPEIERLFRIAPAARGMHHAFRSGLLEHTVSMVGAARGLATHYGLNESLVIAGTLLHDLGKVWELEIGASIEYTDEGRLLGHLTLEVLHVEKVISELPSFPAETRRQLLHILLAHHGEYAYGAPRRPKTPEALLVHMVDNLDSKMAGMFEAIELQAGSDQPWTQYSKILDRFVYRRRLEE